MYKICKYQLQMAFSSPRTYMAFFFGSVMQIVSVIPLLDFAEKIQKPLCIWEGFIYFSCDTYIIAATFLGIIIMVSDIPFSSEMETYTLLRITRKKWIIGKIFYLLCVCSLYYLCILFVGMIFIGEKAYIGNFWSEPVYFLTKQIDWIDSSLYFPYSHVMILSPFEAVVSGFLLTVGYGFLMSLLLFLFSLNSSRTLGYLGTMSIHAIGYVMTVLFLSKKAVKYSLFGNSLLMYHEIGCIYEGQFMDLYETILLYAVCAIIVAKLIFRIVKRNDFRITTGSIQ